MGGIDALRGVVVPMLTPLTKDERLDSASLQRQIGYLLGAGVDGIFVLGSMGEGAMLRAATRHAMARETVAIVDGRIPVICGLLEVSTGRVLEELDHLGGLGLDGYVATTPLYFDGFAEADLLRHFQLIAERADAPMFLYNIPQFTRAAISERLVRELASDPKIVGIKDSSGNWSLFQHLVLDRPNKEFILLQGSQPMAAISLFIGCDGLVPGYANIHARLFVEMVERARAKDWPSVLKCQAQLDRLLRVRGPALMHGSKLLGKALGLMDDNISSPLPRLDREAAASLLEASFAAGLPATPYTPALPDGAPALEDA